VGKCVGVPENQDQPRGNRATMVLSCLSALRHLRQGCTRRVRRARARPLLRAGSARRTALERAGAVADINSRGCQPLLNARDCRSKLTAPAGELPLASSSAGMRNARLCGRRVSAAPSRPERRSWTFIARAAGQSGKQFEWASLVRVECTLFMQRTRRIAVRRDPASTQVCRRLP
jgi:hypothetical protein